MRNNQSDLGNSIYQFESKKYYTLLRDIHTKIFTFNSKRIEAEKKTKRYFNGNVEGIRNLYTFVNILQKLMQNKTEVKGVDYGCGNHYFINDTRKQFGWDVIGYDVDEIAIEAAKEKYSENADRYIHLNLLKNRIPLENKSQDFVFCNAVIQHFDNMEVSFVLEEIGRILKPGGVLVLIFKRNVDNWSKFSRETGLKVKVLDAKEGKIKIEDESMKKAIQELDDHKKSALDHDTQKGLRLFHFFSIEGLIDIAKQKGFDVFKNIEVGNEKLDKAILTYRSGKGIPTAAIFFLRL
jgi:SAM-dependent methyltransferase